MRRLVFAIAMFGLIASGCGGGKAALPPAAVVPLRVTTTTMPSAMLPPVPAGQYRYQGAGRANPSLRTDRATRSDPTYEFASSQGDRQRFWDIAHPTNVTEIEYRGDGVYLVGDADPGAGLTFTPPAPLLLLPLPAKAGGLASFEAVSADGCKRLEYSARVDGATTVELGGKSVNTVQVTETRRYQDTGKERCKTGERLVRSTVWYLPQYYLPIRRNVSVTDDAGNSAAAELMTLLLRSPIPV